MLSEKEEVNKTKNKESKLFSINTLIKSGVNFGGERKTWNPKNKQYIYTEKKIKDGYSSREKKINIINSNIIRDRLQIAYDYLHKISEEGKSVLFVGTSSEYLTDLIQEESTRSNTYYINYKWQGGTLTNFKTIRAQIKKMMLIEKQEVDGTLSKLSKNECIKIRKEYYKLKNKLNGIKKMVKLPDCVVVFDAKNDRIAILEANKLNIPVIALVNTDADPSDIDILIPGNTNSKKSLFFVVTLLNDAIVSGKKLGVLKVANHETIDFSEFEAQNNQMNNNNKKENNTNDNKNTLKEENLKTTDNKES